MTLSSNASFSHILPRPIRCDCCDIWYALGGKAAGANCDTSRKYCLGLGSYKDTPCPGRVLELCIAWDMTTPSCKVPEEAQADATGNNPRTSVSELIPGSQKTCLGVPSWKRYSTTFLIRHPIRLSTTRHTLSTLFEMHCICIMAYSSASV